MSGSVASDDVLSSEWPVRHFDHFDPEFGSHFHEILGKMRERCPVAYSDQHGGFWVATRYEDVLTLLQDWHTYSSVERVAIPVAAGAEALPMEEMDPPLHRQYKRFLNAYFTPAVVAQYEDPTRSLVSSLIDGFIEEGRCEFVAAFADHLPRRSFFDLVLHAPPDDVGRLNELTRIATGPPSPQVEDAYAGMAAWIGTFIDHRRSAPPRGDVVDAMLTTAIDGQPISLENLIGLFMLLMFGGFETTTSALAQIMLRFATEPDIPDQLRAEPTLVPAAVEEFLRIDSPVVCMARTATRDTVLGAQSIRKGEKILFQLASANRDAAEFDSPDVFDHHRPRNRHVAFGAGPHRCLGSNLARMNLRVSVEELTARLEDLRLQDGARPIEFRTAFNRSPLAVPIAFKPGRRLPTASAR